MRFCFFKRNGTVWCFLTLSMLVVRGHGLLDSSMVPSQNHIFHYLSRTSGHWERVWQLLFRRTFLLGNSAWFLSIWWDSTPLQSNMLVTSALLSFSCSLCGLRSQRTLGSSHLNHVNGVKIWFKHHLGTKASWEQKWKSQLPTLLEIFPLACAGPWTCQIHG